MKDIKITVADKKATVQGTPIIVCGNSDYTVTFSFDAEWSLTGPKTARFVYIKNGEKQHEDKVFSGSTVAVPVLSDVAFVQVGVFEGDLATTTPARILCSPSILCGTGSTPDSLTEDVYNQLLALVVDLAEKGAFGATEEQMQQIEQNKQSVQQLAANKADQFDLDVLAARMNTFTKLAEGSTTGDAELEDIRVGADGTVYENAGEAVREQVSDLKNGLSNTDNGLKLFQDNIKFVKNLVTEIHVGKYSENSSTGVKMSDAAAFGCVQIAVGAGRSYSVSKAPMETNFSFFTDKDLNFIGYLTNYKKGAYVYEAPADGYLFLCNSNWNDANLDLVVLEASNSITTLSTSDYPYNELISVRFDVPLVANTHFVGKGQTHETIRSACAAAKDGDMVYVFPGTYREQLHLFGKNIHLVGADKYACIIIDSSGDYRTPPVEMNMGTISNFTIIEDFADDNSAVPENYRYPYCIHCESRTNIGDGATLVIDNCIMVNEKQACFGLGLQQNLTVVMRNCELTTKFDENRSDSITCAFLWHTSVNDNVGNQHLIIENNRIHSESQYAMTYSNVGSNGECDYTFINNHFYAENGTPNSDAIILKDYRENGSTFELTRKSWGNNTPVLNYVGD